jgi:hypothetical protein
MRALQFALHECRDRLAGSAKLAPAGTGLMPSFDAIRPLPILLAWLLIYLPFDLALEIRVISRVSFSAGGLERSTWRKTWRQEHP